MDAFKEVISIFSGLIVLAIIAVLVSNNAQTSKVATSIFSGFGGDIQAADSPVDNSFGGSNINYGGNTVY